MSVFPARLTELFQRQTDRRRDFEASIADGAAEVLQLSEALGVAALAAFDAEQAVRESPADRTKAKSAAVAFARRDKLAEEHRQAEDRVKALRAARSAADARDTMEQDRLADVAEADKQARLRDAFGALAEAAKEFDEQVGGLEPILEKFRAAQNIVRDLAGGSSAYPFSTAAGQIIPSISRRLRRFTTDTLTSQDPKLAFWSTFAPRPDQCGIKLTEKE